MTTTSQNAIGHPDCVFHNAPIGSVVNKQVGAKSKNAVINATIRAKEKFDELLSLFNRTKAKNLKVLSVIHSESSIDSPLIYSPTLIAQELSKLQSQMSPSLKKAIFENGRLDVSNISEVDIIKYGAKIGGLYDLAIRYELLSTNKAAYKKLASKDIRGFYYLYTKKVNADTLKRFEGFNNNEQEEIKNALLGICRNNDVKVSSCTKELNASLKRNMLDSYYKKYINKATEAWNSYFQIPKHAVRNDITYRNDVLEVPFAMPENKKLHDFVRGIEDYWKHSGLMIELDFQNKKNIPNLTLKENSVAHVNKLGGNDIIMNASIDMNLSKNQLVLNHEFGHVLGLPDCYIEFYDEEKDAFVNYQIMKTDMMCSTSGKITSRIVQELKRVYGH